MAGGSGRETTSVGAGAGGGGSGEAGVGWMGGAATAAGGAFCAIAKGSETLGVVRRVALAGEVARRSGKGDGFSTGSVGAAASGACVSTELCVEAEGDDTEAAGSAAGCGRSVTFITMAPPTAPATTSKAICSGFTGSSPSAYSDACQAVFVTLRDMVTID